MGVLTKRSEIRLNDVDNHLTQKLYQSQPGTDVKPLVTVLLPTYNRVDYLSFAIESVLRQRYPRFELIVIRDGGKSVASIVNSYSDDRIRFINRSENRGKAASLNEAIQYARGDYISYLDDDDIWYPNHLEVLVNTLQDHPEIGVAYSDLYKAHYRLLSGPRRQVLSKNVEISRAFDRLLMLQFNHVLHVSLMHRRDLLEKAGPYNEQLNVLIDWDLTRRLCFYTDFLHVPVITGEYYAAIENSDRISIQRRKNVSDYMRNLLTIRSHRPPKPWPCMQDLSVFVMYEKADEILNETLRMLWGHTFYPSEVYLPMTDEEFDKIRSGFPNLVQVRTERHSDINVSLDTMLDVCEGDYVAVVPSGLSVAPNESCLLERSLNPLLSSSQSQIAFEIVEADSDHWGAVFRKDELRHARKMCPDLTLKQAARTAGIEIRKPAESEYPFQFDNLLTAVTDLMMDCQWKRTVPVLEYMVQHYGNHNWMQTLRANALYYADNIHDALTLAQQLNHLCPTVARLLIEARCNKKSGQFDQAVELYRRAEGILEGKPDKHPGTVNQILDQQNSQTMDASDQRQENLTWTS